MKAFKRVFRGLPDPRADNARHDLCEVLFIALAATLCGDESCAEMAEFGQSKEGFLRLLLRLEHGIPSHDTFSRVFRLLEPEAFEKAFRRFIEGFAKANKLTLTGVVAIDGKALRGAFERGRQSTPLHMVNIWAVEARICLAQRKAPGRNESAGAMEALAALNLEGCIVTADALHCHRGFAAVVRERGGDYVLALKANRSKLFATASSRFTRGGERSVAEQIEPCSHDRREARRATVLRAARFADEADFPGVKALGRITSRRRYRGKAADPPSVRYFLLSKYVSAKGLLTMVRSHWSIENQLHWVLDVVMNEDKNRARKDHAPENLATLRRLALNILRAHPDGKSIRRKIKRAGWDDAFLTSIISHMR
jgi:predicted transposase YbfD/YdcC